MQIEIEKNYLIIAFLISYYWTLYMYVSQRLRPEPHTHTYTGSPIYFVPTDIPYETAKRTRNNLHNFNAL